MSVDASSAAATFEYLPHDTVLTGLESATIGVTPQTLRDRSGVQWTNQDDELGSSVLSIFRLQPGGPRFSLRFYEDAPFPGVIVSSDADAEPADIDILFASLGVDDEEIIDRVPVRAAHPSMPSAEAASSSSGKGRDGHVRSTKAPKAAPSRSRGDAPTLSKSALIQAVAANSGLSKAASARAIDSLLDTVTETLKRGDQVSISGFGKFSVTHRAARKGVNPRTGERIKIKACKAPRFTPATNLKRTV